MPFLATKAIPNQFSFSTKAQKELKKKTKNRIEPGGEATRRREEKKKQPTPSLRCALPHALQLRRHHESAVPSGAPCVLLFLTDTGQASKGLSNLSYGHKQLTLKHKHNQTDSYSDA